MYMRRHLLIIKEVMTLAIVLSHHHGIAQWGDDRKDKFLPATVTVISETLCRAFEKYLCFCVAGASPAFSPNFLPGSGIILANSL